MRQLLQACRLCFYMIGNRFSKRKRDSGPPARDNQSPTQIDAARQINKSCESTGERQRCGALGRTFSSRLSRRSHRDCRAQPREDDVGNPIYVNTDNSDPKKKLFNAGALSNAAAIEKKM